MLGFIDIPTETQSAPILTVLPESPLPYANGLIV